MHLSRTLQRELFAAGGSYVGRKLKLFQYHRIKIVGVIPLMFNLAVSRVAVLSARLVSALFSAMPDEFLITNKVKPHEAYVLVLGPEFIRVRYRCSVLPRKQYIRPFVIAIILYFYAVWKNYVKYINFQKSKHNARHPYRIY